MQTLKAPTDPKEETRLLLDGYRAILHRCPDRSLYSAFNEVYRTYFKNDFPARAFIGSRPLLFGGLFEMQAIAVKQ